MHGQDMSHIMNYSCKLQRIFDEQQFSKRKNIYKDYFKENAIYIKICIEGNVFRFTPAFMRIYKNLLTPVDVKGGCFPFHIVSIHLYVLVVWFLLFSFFFG